MGAGAQQGSRVTASIWEASAGPDGSHHVRGPRFSPGGWQLFARILRLLRLGPGSLTQLKVEKRKGQAYKHKCIQPASGEP